METMRGIVKAAARPFVAPLIRRFQRVHARLDEVEAKVAEVRGCHLTELRSQLAVLQSQPAALPEPRDCLAAMEPGPEREEMPDSNVRWFMPVETQETASFVDGLRFRNKDIWNLPLTRFDDRYDLFNHIVASYLADSAASRKSSATKLRFLEIGVWKAGTLPPVAKRFGPIFDYIGVDPYGMLIDDPYRGSFWTTDEEAEATYRAAKAIFDRHEAALIRQSSRDFFESDKTIFDVVFVDGDHRYAGALYDCEVGFERLRSGGLLIVDDVGNSFHPEVEWSVREFTRRHQREIRRMGAQPLFFQLEGMPVPVVLIFTYFQKV